LAARRWRLVLALGDTVALAGFILVGMGNHETLTQPGGVVRLAVNAGPMLAAWTLAALAVGAWDWPPRQVQGARRWGARALLAWLVAAPLALLARALLLRAATIVVIFFLVTLGLGGAVLLAWRAVFWLIAHRRLAAAPRAPAGSRIP
jgi:hypothetical protein